MVWKCFAWRFPNFQTSWKCHLFFKSCTTALNLYSKDHFLVIDQKRGGSAGASLIKNSPKMVCFEFKMSKICIWDTVRGNICNSKSRTLKCRINGVKCNAIIHFGPWGSRYAIQLHSLFKTCITQLNLQQLRTAFFNFLIRPRGGVGRLFDQ